MKVEIRNNGTDQTIQPIHSASEMSSDSKQPNSFSDQEPGLTASRELISRSVARKLVEQSDLPGGREGMSAEFWIAQVSDVFSYLFGRIGLPLELRAYVLALIGASEGRTDWFECSDRALAVRLIGDAADGKTPNALKKKIQRMRKKLNDWQQEHKFVLVETDIGFAESLRNEIGEVITYPDGSRELEYHPTRYRLPILPHATQILREAFSNPNRIGDVSLVAKRLIGLLRDEPKVWDSAGRSDGVRQLRRLRSMGKTSIKKAIQLERIQGGNPRRLFKEVMKEVEAEAILPSDPADLEIVELEFDEIDSTTVEA